MKLKELLNGIAVVSQAAPDELEINGISYDSRAVRSGNLFVAITGYAADGHKYIPAAIQNGAAVILCEHAPELDTPYVIVENTRLAMALISANFFDHPADKMTMIGITGTNGKTSSSYLVKHVLEEALGARVGLIGTIQNMIGSTVIPTERTTPDSYELQKLLADMVAAGCTHVVMEVSSHSLVLDRVAGIHFRTAMFTNLTQDHLDFHGTMEAYCAAKAILFTRCDSGVLNGDDAASVKIAETAACTLMTYGTSAGCNLRAEHTLLHSDGVEYTAVFGNEQALIQLCIPGAFSVYNSLGVVGIALSLGISLGDIASALKTASGVKGRVEVVPTPGKDYTILIDYAHTPDGLENVLNAVRGYCKGRLIAVFGCGGDRDNTKRPIMGEIGARLSDIPIITSDNPRTEDPASIIDMILAGIPADRMSECLVEVNRPRAIAMAMDLAQKDDIIVLCGKGHETYQEINHVKHHLDEREVVAAHLEAERESAE